MFDIIRGDTPRYSPIEIPAALKYAEWDFEVLSQITTAGGVLSSFAEPITGGAFVQATGALQPSHSLSVFNTRAAGVFDGARSLRNTTAVATLGWPTSGAFEFWAATEYTGALLPSDNTQVYIFNYPVNSVNTSVLLSVAGSVSGITVARCRVGTGAASVIVDGSVNIATGRHIIRVVSDGATVRVDVDGIAGTPVACVASGWTGGPRHTIGGSSAVTATSMFTGNMSYLAFTKPLHDYYATSLYRNLNLRKG